MTADASVDAGKYELQTLKRGAAVLDLLLEYDAFTLSEAAAALGLGNTVTYRLLRTWCASGYLHYDARSKRYSAGLDLMRLAAKARATVGFPAAEARVQALAPRIDQTCSCSVLAGRYVLYVARVLGNRALTYHVEVGKTLPAEVTSTGQALLAFEPEARIDELYPEPTLPYFTHRSPSSVTELKARLAEVRERGYAINEGQHSQGINAVAVPVRDPSGRVVAALSVAGPATEVTREVILERYLPELRAAAAEPLEVSFGV